MGNDKCLGQFVKWTRKIGRSATRESREEVFGVVTLCGGLCIPNNATKKQVLLNRYDQVDIMNEPVDD